MNRTWELSAHGGTGSCWLSSQYALFEWPSLANSCFVESVSEFVWAIDLMSPRIFEIIPLLPFYLLPPHLQCRKWIRQYQTCHTSWSLLCSSKDLEAAISKLTKKRGKICTQHCAPSNKNICPIQPIKHPFCKGLPIVLELGQWSHDASAAWGLCVLCKHARNLFLMQGKC